MQSGKPPAPLRRVLVVDDDPAALEGIRTALAGAGHAVDTVHNGREALARLENEVPDLVISDVDLPWVDGFELLARVRSGPTTQAVPLILVSQREAAEDAVRGLRLGADDYVRQPVAPAELVARVEAKFERPPVPAKMLPRHPGTPLLSTLRLREELNREIERFNRTGRSGCVAALDLAERSSVVSRLGPRADRDLHVEVSAISAGVVGDLDLVGVDVDGRLLVLMPETDPEEASRRLLHLSERVTASSLTAVGEPITGTAVAGFAVLGPDAAEADVYIQRAVAAAAVAAEQMDLLPVRWTPEIEAARKARTAVSWVQRLRTPAQIVLSLVLGVVLPFLVYAGAERAGVHVADVVYLVVVAALLVTGTLIWVEGFLALRPDPLPPEPASGYPAASAIIAAYLPNEAATVVETVEAFLRVEYPGTLQVVLAYNTPQALPVEAVLAEIAAREPRFVPYRVDASTSKAQNVNAALSVVTGEFVGVFDADHHPDADAFRRAWRWLAHGYDVVQGHCVVRNGDTSWVARTVAVEFEAIYGVSHPGRARLHGFGIFGGSNGYWRTSLLRQVRMHGFMLTEDIDSSIRTLQAGGQIAVDPWLISRELAPTTVRALWKQRTRWAQGWFQVSLKHLRAGLRSEVLSVRQKLGVGFLLGWREVYPWLSLQVVPLLGFFAWRAGSVSRLDWFIPIFALTTVYTLGVGPGQTFFAWRLGVNEIRQRSGWFLAYLLVSSLFYTEMKNLISRVAQIKEAMGDRQWTVTTRCVTEPEGARRT